MTQALVDEAAVSSVPPARQSLWKAMLRNPLSLIGLIVLATVILVAVFASWLAPMDPTTPSFVVNAPPGTPDHLLGTDSSGRDLLSRLIYGSRMTLLGALIAIVVALVVGVPSGLVAGYFGGATDNVTSYVANVLLSLPNMVVLLAVIAALGPSLVFTMVAFGVLLSPGLFRLVRAQVMAVRNDLYVDAARVSGLSNTRIIGRHVLFVVRAPIIIQASILTGIAIIVQSGLGFLGLDDPSVPTWGGMLGNAFGVIYLAPWSIVWPGAAIAITVASLVLVGNGLRDAVQGVDAGAERVRRRRRSRVAASRPPVEAVASARSADEAPVTAIEDSGAALVVRHLKIGYPQPDGTDRVVVRDVSFSIRRGEVRGLVGESGSGKTQTAFAILGLLPTGGTVMAGEILLHGRNLVGMPDKERRTLLGKAIGYIPQEPMSNLDPAFTIGHQLIWPLIADGMKRGAATEKVLGLLAEVGIPDPKRTFRAYPHQVSGGMAQRVLIAGAIASDPDLLIADEATTALDVTVQAEVLNLLRRLQRDRHMAVLLVTHNFGVVADICDTVAVMRNGAIIEEASAEELFAHPREDYTRMLLESTLEDAVPRSPIGTASRRLSGQAPRERSGE